MKKTYLVIVTLVYLAFTVVFLTFPRSTFSALEKRDLARFPQFSWQTLASGAFAADVSRWFSDSEPYRDAFMTLSMAEKEAISLTVDDEEQVTFHASADQSKQPTAEELEAAERNVGEYANNINANENAKIANNGIIIVGKGDKVRALMAYGGGAEGGVEYARAANRYQKEFPNVQVYCMVVPTAAAYYTPEKAQSRTRDQRPTIKNIFAHLDQKVKAVEVYSALGQHAREDIYFRTDHHWAPLGAFYAAQEFARVAGVPFRDLKAYDRHVVHGYVGSMYGYSKDIAVKNAPEDFVYFTPRDVKYETTAVLYRLNEDYKVSGESKPYKTKFFYEFHDGSPHAYGTFMGGDSYLVKVQTSTKNHRRVMILKDSFGNCIPGYLFYSFEEVHVVDFRYFTKNMRQYVRDNRITDILFCNNIFNCYFGQICERYVSFLDQANGTMATQSSDTKKDAPKGKKKDVKKEERKEKREKRETIKPAEAPEPTKSDEPKKPIEEATPTEEN